MTETFEPDTPMPTSEPEAAINGGEDQPSLNAENDASTTSDSDSDDSDSEAQEILHLQNLEAELSANPSNYDAHVQYIKCLRKQGDVEKLRQAREAMSELFPLAPIMWQEWAKDEISLASSRPEGYDAIEKLYERGISEYLSVSLWCDYLNFIQAYEPSVCQCSMEGVTKARNLFERAVTAGGLHLVEGSRIWEAYREFEQAILIAIDETDVEAKEKQVLHIRSIFLRQLAVPIVDIKATLLAYKAWEVKQGHNVDATSESLDGVASQVASAYQRALEMYNARAHFEEQISSDTKKNSSDADKIQHYMTYLKYEESSGDPVRAQILYERAVAEFPVSTDIWLDYTRYMDKTLKVGSVVRNVYSRATRNCPWVGALWAHYLLCLERSRASEEDISAVFEKSLQCSFASFDEYLDLFVTRIDGLRRRSCGIDDALDYSLIRGIFQRASDYLSAQLKDTDNLLHLFAYWSRLELDLGKDLAAARGVWESLTKISGSTSEAWKGYIEMEVKLGHINEARSLFKRCYCKRLLGMGSEEICYAWLRFEREYGSLDDYDHAVRKVTPRLNELQVFRLQQESNGVTSLTDQKGHFVKKNLDDKRKPPSNLKDEQPPPKRQKTAAQSLKSSSGKVNPHAQNSVKVIDPEDIKINVGKASNTSEQEQEQSAARDAKVYKDLCTVFLSNLSLKATEQNVREFFGNGGVLNIRILRERFTGKSRGLAYVDFSNDAHLTAALAKNKRFLLEKKVSVRRSDPSKARNKGSTGSASTEYGKNTGHAQNLKQASSRQTAEEFEASVAQTSSHAVSGQGNDNLEFKGKKAAALPGAMDPARFEEDRDDKPKSNDEFRNMFLKK